MKHEKRFLELLGLMRTMDPEDERAIPYYFLGAMSSVIERNEGKGKRTIPIEEVVRCLELACENHLKKK